MPYSEWQLAQLPQIDPAIVRAAVNGDVAAVRQWLDDGNDPNFRYDVIGNGDVVLAGIGKTLLHEVASDSITYRITVDDTEAVERGRCDIARLLLARGAVPDPLRVGGDPSYVRMVHRGRAAPTPETPRAFARLIGGPAPASPAPQCS